MRVKLALLGKRTFEIFYVVILMKNRDIRYIGISASWLSICVIGLAMLRAAGTHFDIGIILFILWGISPYAILIAGEFVIRKIAVIPKITKFFCVISVLLLALTIYACIEVFTSRSSTAGLMFVFLPFYLNLLVVISVVSGLIWASRSKSSQK